MSSRMTTPERGTMLPTDVQSYTSHKFSSLQDVFSEFIGYLILKRLVIRVIEDGGQVEYYFIHRLID